MMQQPEIVKQAQQAIVGGERSLLDALPAMVKRMVKDQIWRDQCDKHGEPFKSFREFAEYKLWWGLECKWERLVNYCEHDKECHALLLDQIEPAKTHGGERKQGDNVPLNQRGNSQQHAIKRLKRDRPDLAKKVVNGEITANAAAIEAGFRKPMKSIPIDTPKSAIASLLRVFTREQLLDALK